MVVGFVALVSIQTEVYTLMYTYGLDIGTLLSIPAIALTLAAWLLVAPSEDA
jgi:hypothetical protein